MRRRGHEVDRRDWIWRRADELATDDAVQAAFRSLATYSVCRIARDGSAERCRANFEDALPKISDAALRAAFRIEFDRMVYRCAALDSQSARETRHDDATVVPYPAQPRSAGGRDGRPIVT